VSSFLARALAGLGLVVLFSSLSVGDFYHPPVAFPPFISPDCPLYDPTNFFFSLSFLVAFSSLQFSLF